MPGYAGFAAQMNSQHLPAPRPGKAQHRQSGSAWRAGKGDNGVTNQGSSAFDAYFAFGFDRVETITFEVGATLRRLV